MLTLVIVLVVIYLYWTLHTTRKPDEPPILLGPLPIIGHAHLFFGDTIRPRKNCTLKPGHNCFMSLYGIHRNPMWGPDVNKFKPERWLDPATLPTNPNAFASFTFGKRSCIGKTYAMMTLKTLLSHVLRRYRIRADHTKLLLKLDILLKPVTGQEISIEERLKEYAIDRNISNFKEISI